MSMHLRLDDSTVLFGGRDPGDGELTDPISQELSDGAETPVPETDGQRGGPVARVTDQFVPLGATTLRRLMLSGGEAAEAIRTRRDELYRNEFPRSYHRRTRRPNVRRNGCLSRSTPPASHSVTSQNAVRRTSGPPACR